LLLLDEPTSALDAHAEAEVRAGLEALAHGRTAVVVAHRLSTVRKADRIFVLREGRCVEQGSFEELRASGGFFTRMLEAHELG
jgi:ABC-type multidrug transport system fused ATPase/permease subunit